MNGEANNPKFPVTLEALERGALQEPELCDRFIRTAHDETVRLSRLIQDLLDLGRLEAGVAPLEKQAIALQALIDRAVKAIELQTLPNSVNICQNLPDIILRVDSERLLQALLNILDNASEYSMPGSTIFIFGRREDNQVVVEIEDRGVGIDRADLPHVFDEFYRADSSRQKDGTGLGLAISRRIVEAHGGSIIVNSVVGKGTRMSIRLPVQNDKF